MFYEIDNFRDTLTRREVKRQPWTVELMKALDSMESWLQKYYQKTERPAVYVDTMIFNSKIKLIMFKGPEWDAGDADKYKNDCKDRYKASYDKLIFNSSL